MESSDMDALTFQGCRNVAFQRVPRPQLQEPTDVIVRVELCGLCGSDLHPYFGREQGLDAGTVMGHEFVGQVHQAGSGVSKFRLGDRVMSPFTTCCGACFYCTRGLTCRCARGQLFGWREAGRGLHGAQAQYVRVPMADATLVHVPDAMSNEHALLLGDILSTAFFCADSADIPGLLAQSKVAAAAAAAAAEGCNDSADGCAAAPLVAADGPGSANGGAIAASAAKGACSDRGCGEGVVVAVVGCGPVGLLAVLAARELKATTVLAVDSVPERLALAERFGAVPINHELIDPMEAVRAATGGRGADAVLELVGAPAALRVAYNLLRPGGVLSSMGCHSEPTFPFSPTEAYNKNVTFRVGRCPARHFMDRLQPLMQQGGLGAASDIISHRLPLREGPEAYQRFAAREMLKVVMDPWA